MAHLPTFIQDLAIILMTAAVVGLLFKKLNQPLVLGYLLAGYLVGPHVPITPTVIEMESVRTWADIGVIFLLFGLGLEFSFKKLRQVGGGIIGTALIQTVCMMAIGYSLGIALGWTSLSALFLGGTLSISSTVIIVRAVEEMGLKSRKFVPIAFGVLIVEDLVAILLLVLLSSLAVSKEFSGVEMGTTAARLLFYVIIWFVLGFYLIPPFLRWVRRQLNDEITLIVAIGLCLMMVVVATQAGFSSALGAFVMGSLLAETQESHRIEKVIQPLKDLFAAVFFVSVGMMFDPAAFAGNIGVVLLVSAVLIAGKVLSTSTAAVLSGYSVKHAVQTGFSLAQIGEFSFIIATLGLTLKATNETLYPITISVAAITSFTTPYLIRASTPIYEWLEKKFSVKPAEPEVDNELKLAPWDAGLVDYTLSPHSRLAGQTLLECALKERFNVSVALIERGGRKIVAPNRTDRLFPFDRLFLIGTEDNLLSAQKAIEIDESAETPRELTNYGLESLVLTEASPYVGKNIRECGLRERVGGLIVGIERDNKRILNPESGFVLAVGDRVWIVGDIFKIKTLD